MDCEKALEYFSPARDDRLEEPEKAEFEAHIEECEKCRLEFGRYNRMLDAARDVEPIEAGGDFERTLAARLSRELTLRPGRRVSPLRAAAAALIIVLAGAGGFLVGEKIGRDGETGRNQRDSEVLAEKENGYNNGYNNDGDPVAVPRTRTFSFVAAPRGDVSEDDFSEIIGATQRIMDIGEEVALTPVEKKRQISEHFRRFDFPTAISRARARVASMPENVQIKVLPGFNNAANAVTNLQIMVTADNDWTPEDIEREFERFDVDRSLKMIWMAMQAEMRQQTRKSGFRLGTPPIETRKKQERNREDDKGGEKLEEKR